MTKIYNRYTPKERRSELRNNMTKAEKILWQHINRDALGVRFRRQYGIAGYIVDFYCPELKLVVEVDGSSHQHEQIFSRDQTREQKLRELGLTIVRLTDMDIFDNLENSLIDLAAVIGKLKI